MEENNNIVSNKKNAIIGIVAIAVVVLIVILGVNLLGPSPAKTVKKFCKYMNEGEVSKAFELVDFESVYVLSELDEDEYEDYKKEYKDFKDDDDAQEEFEEGMEYIEEMVETLEDSISDYDEFSVEVDEIKSTKKEGSKIWKVKAKIEYKMEYEEEYIDEDEKETLEFYVVKKGMKYYLAGGDGLSTIMAVGSYSYY